MPTNAVFRQAVAQCGVEQIDAEVDRLVEQLPDRLIVLFGITDVSRAKRQRKDSQRAV